MSFRRSTHLLTPLLTALLLLAQGFVANEWTRGGMVLLAIGAIAYPVWSIDRKRLSRAGAWVFFSGMSGLATVALFSGLNVIRYFTYNAAAEDRTPLATIYWIVVESQDITLWLGAICGAIYAVAFLIMAIQRKRKLRAANV